MKQARAPALISPAARGPGRPVTIPAIAANINSTAIRANTAASARTRL